MRLVDLIPGSAEGVADLIDARPGRLLSMRSPSGEGQRRGDDQTRAHRTTDAVHEANLLFGSPPVSVSLTAETIRVVRSHVRTRARSRKPRLWPRRICYCGMSDAASAGHGTHIADDPRQRSTCTCQHDHWAGVRNRLEVGLLAR